jgi:uncharacterized small protein (DUF1192 family)
MSQASSLPQWLKEHQQMFPAKVTLQKQIETETDLVKQIDALKSEMERLKAEIAFLKMKR